MSVWFKELKKIPLAECTEYIHFTGLLSSLGFQELGDVVCRMLSAKVTILVVAVVDVTLSYNYSLCCSANKWRF